MTPSPKGRGGPREPEGAIDAGGEAGPEPPDDEAAPGGIFRSWRALYLTLAIYTGIAVGVLLFLTRLLNRGGP